MNMLESLVENEGGFTEKVYVSLMDHLSLSEFKNPFVGMETVIIQHLSPAST